MFKPAGAEINEVIFLNFGNDVSILNWLAIGIDDRVMAVNPVLCTPAIAKSRVRIMALRQ